MKYDNKTMIVDLYSSAWNKKSLFNKSVKYLHASNSVKIKNNLIINY